MKTHIMKNEGNELVIEFETDDYTIPDLIASQLLEDDDVEFAGVAKDHPEVGKPRLVVKTGKKKPVVALSKALEVIDDQIAGIKAEFSSKK